MLHKFHLNASKLTETVLLPSGHHKDEPIRTRFSLNSEELRKLKQASIRQNKSFIIGVNNPFIPHSAGRDLLSFKWTPQKYFVLLEVVSNFLAMALRM